MAKIKLKVSKNLKKRAKNVCEDIDLSLETVLNVFLLKLTEEKRIPFEVTDELIRSAKGKGDKKDKEDKDDDKKEKEDQKDDPALEDLEEMGQTAMKDNS